jgi:hypothetical protein
MEVISQEPPGSLRYLSISKLCTLLAETKSIGSHHVALEWDLLTEIDLGTPEPMVIHRLYKGAPR